MSATKLGVLVSSLAMACAASVLAQEHPEHAEHGGAMTARPPAHGEPHPGPKGYNRVAEPHGWNARPEHFDPATYHHNFQASRVYHIGVYHRPVGWVSRRWGYGEILPRAYWAPSYFIADYWLFALEVPPPGYEWVRVDTDAILVNIQTGEILQVEYGVFA